MDAKPNLMPVAEGFPRPDWARISDLIHSQPEDTWAKDWLSWMDAWLSSTLEVLPGEYRVDQSANFALLSAEEDRYVELMLQFMERALKKITTGLTDIASDEGFGKHVVLIFNEQQPYYDYLSYFYPDEGEFILSSGIFLDHGYGHFAFPFLEMYEAEAISAHELTTRA